MFKPYQFGYIIKKEGLTMLKKLPWKNILIVATAILVVPVLAFVMTITANPFDGATDQNSDIKITSDNNTLDASSAASTDLTSSGLGRLDAASGATAQNQNSPGSAPDAVSSATSNSGTIGSIQGDDDQYEDDDDEDEGDDD